jgi:hypothetical protein
MFKILHSLHDDNLCLYTSIEIMEMPLCRGFIRCVCVLSEIIRLYFTYTYCRIKFNA